MANEQVEVPRQPAPEAAADAGETPVPTAEQPAALSVDSFKKVAEPTLDKVFGNNTAQAAGGESGQPDLKKYAENLVEKGTIGLVQVSPDLGSSDQVGKNSVGASETTGDPEQPDLAGYAKRHVDRALDLASSGTSPDAGTAVPKPGGGTSGGTGEGKGGSPTGGQA